MGERVAGTPPIKKEGEEQKGVREEERNKLGKAQPPKAKAREERRNGARRE